MAEVAKWKIEKITHLDGKDREDGRYPQRINSTVCIISAGIGCQMVWSYITDGAGNEKDGVLRTSYITDKKHTEYGKKLVVTTRNSVYYFEKIDDMEGEPNKTIRR